MGNQIALLLTLGLAGQMAVANMKVTLRKVHPTTEVTSRKCDIKIDCPKYSISVNGVPAGQIICAPDTGKKFSGKKITLARSVTPAGGKYLPRGFPMLATEPELCDDCFIHVYPYVGPGNKSLGCVG